MSFVQLLVKTIFGEEAPCMDFQKDSVSLCSKVVGNKTFVILGYLNTSLAYVVI